MGGTRRRVAAGIERNPDALAYAVQGSVDKAKRPAICLVPPDAQVAELVDALVSGTSGESRGGSSPLLGTISRVRGYELSPSHSIRRQSDSVSLHSERRR